ncbi:MAG: glycosyltransferase [Chloroflexota bacterium]|nr:glycosyltransferase [Chloroflexota bacterium]
MKTVLVHDWLNQIGGAENVLETLVEMFPEAQVYTSIYAADRMPESYREWEIRTSTMQHLPLVASHHQAYLPFYPLAFEQFDFTGYDLVLSNKSAFCHGVVTPPETLHICYCLTPTRFLWMYDSYRAREGLGAVTDLVLRPLLSRLRLWDRLAADRVDHFVAISRVVQQRIRTYYRRDSDIIYPPVDVERFTPSDRSPGDYYLAGGRLIPYKRVDLAVDAFNELGLPLIVFGDGRDRAELESRAASNITFLGRVSWDTLADLFQHCQAFVFPGLEDFGIAPVEAQAAGRPVIAYAGGGALDTVIPGKTGVLFFEQTAETLAETVRSFDVVSISPGDCRENAERFSQERFRLELMNYVEARLVEHQAGISFRTHWA